MNPIQVLFEMAFKLLQFFVVGFVVLFLSFLVVVTLWGVGRMIFAILLLPRALFLDLRDKRDHKENQ